MAHAQGRSGRRVAPGAGGRAWFPALLGAALSAIAIQACARHRLESRPELTPRMEAELPREAALEAAARDPDAGPPLDGAEQSEHALRRASFGPSPAEQQRIAQLGAAGWLEEQLHPESIDDRALDERLAAEHVLGETTAERVQELDRFKLENRAEQAQKALAAADAGSLSENVADGGAPFGQVVSSAPLENAATGSKWNDLKIEPVPNGTSSRLNDHKMELASDGTGASSNHPRPGRKARQELGKIGRGPGFDFTLALAEAKLLRAIYSKRQLNEVMTDFWFNHFNVFAGKDREAALLPAYEDEVIRRHALGSFPELLRAVARSPAMLIYLDNWRSRAPEYDKKGRKRGGGLNENYARELLELHTLGVDGGYTQADVTEVARCFTGWSVEEPGRDPRFVFRPRQHDRGVKHVLGETIPAGGGEDDGDRVLEIVLRHPSTARFLATKLVRRFVSDEPPPELVARVAQRYLDTDGDIRSMLRAIFSSPEFWSRRALRSKMRSPLELVAASARALGADVDDPLLLARQVGRMGEPLFACVPPTGYADTALAWVASGALVARIDFGLALASGKLDGVAVDLAPLAQDAGDPAEVLARASRRLGAAELSARTRDYVLGELADLPMKKRPELVAQRTVGLLLGAPELQER